MRGSPAVQCSASFGREYTVSEEGYIQLWFQCGLVGNSGNGDDSNGMDRWMARPGLFRSPTCFPPYSNSITHRQYEQNREQITTHFKPIKLAVPITESDACK